MRHGERLSVVVDHKQGDIPTQGFDLIADSAINFLCCARPLDGLCSTAERQQKIAAVTFPLTPSQNSPNPVNPKKNIPVR